MKTTIYDFDFEIAGHELYKRLENFIADCKVEEAKESRDAFVKVQTMIYQRMRETKK